MRGVDLLEPPLLNELLLLSARGPRYSASPWLATGLHLALLAQSNLCGGVNGAYEQLDASLSGIAREDTQTKLRIDETF